MSSLTIALVLVGVLASMTKISGANNLDLCKIPKGNYQCRVYYPQWGFDEGQGKCVMYTFAGCEDRDTGFRSESACLQACAGLGQDDCANDESDYSGDDSSSSTQGNPIVNNNWLKNMVNKLENQRPRNRILPFF